MTDKLKILVTGDVEGRFKTLFSRLESINTKAGPFDLLICVGNFFGINNIEWEPYKSGAKKVSIPTYVLGSNNTDHNSFYSDLKNGELCSNVTYLGKRGLYTVSGGLKIAYLSGIDSTNSKASGVHTFSQSDATAVRDACLRGQAEYRGVDILVTSQWPKDITNLDPSKNIVEDNNSSVISWLAVQLKPRYHFSGLCGEYYERPPYRNTSNGENIELATRFIGLARVGNKDKKKWIYAASLTPVARMRMIDLYQKTTDETDSPYGTDLLNVIPGEKQVKSSQFFYDMNAKDDDKKHGKRRGEHGNGSEKKQRREFDQDNCWFCLASPNVEKHLIISVGDFAYLALAKGGLVDDHLLILPVTHHQATSSIPDNVSAEIEKFKSVLRKYYERDNKVPVFFERNYKTSHLQIQVVPIPVRAQVELKEIFQDSAEANGMQLEELPKFSKIEQIAPPGTPFFCVELPTGISLYTRAKRDFPLQFGREVLASGPILDIEERSDWRECNVSKEEESEAAECFRNKFKPFDFTLE